MSEYTDLKNNTYSIKEIFKSTGELDRLREEIMEELFRILSPKK